MILGFDELNKNEFISTNSIINIQEVLEESKAGIRKIPGTVIMNPITSQTVYESPQKEEDIRHYLRNLENYLNGESDLDPLINMAIIHFQFESIHPFYDANGRTGRILNILYLCLKGRLTYPVLYLSKYINDNKEGYYEKLRLSHEDINNLPLFVIYMLKGIEETSYDTINFVNSVVDEMKIIDGAVKQVGNGYYHDDLVDFLYSYFYITIDLYVEKYNVARQTASIHLNELVEDGILKKEKRGRRLVFINIPLTTLMKIW